jgi:hypothetical protein
VFLWQYAMVRQIALVMAIAVSRFKAELIVTVSHPGTVRYRWMVIKLAENQFSDAAWRVAQATLQYRVF